MVKVVATIIVAAIATSKLPTTASYRVATKANAPRWLAQMRRTPAALQGQRLKVSDNNRFLVTERGESEVVPPSSGAGHDWVLVVDDASRGFAAPGTKM